MITAIVQSRMGSSRLPGKAMRIMAGKPMLQHVVERVSACKGIAQVIVATTDRSEDLPIVAWCKKHAIQYVACNRFLPDGMNDVLWRFRQAARLSEDRYFMRVTGDCPLWCPILGAEVIEAFHAHPVEICSNVHPKLDGFDTEIFTRTALIGAHMRADASYDRQHVTPFMYRNGRKHYVDHLPKVGGMKLSVDTEEDFERVNAILKRVSGKGWVEAVKALKL